MNHSIEASESTAQSSKRRGERVAAIARIGAILSAILASACCWLPLALITVGVSGAGIAAGLKTYRPLLIVVTFGFLGAAFYLTYRPRAKVAGDDCCVTVASEYDARNRLKVRTWFDADVPAGDDPDVDPVRIDFRYNAAGRQSVLERWGSLNADAPIVARTTTSYYSNGLTDLLRHINAVDEVLASYDYGHDFGGLVVTEDRVHQNSDYDQTIEYGYDLNGQLIKADFDTQPDEAYRYDDNGNRIRSEDHLGVRLYQTGLANQLLSDGQFRFEYDGEGNMVKKIEIRSDGTDVTATTY